VVLVVDPVVAREVARQTERAVLDVLAQLPARDRILEAWYPCL
jgi:hypothetical protein